MATIFYKVFKHHKKQDGTYNVKFRVTHKRKTVYFPSGYYVTDKQIRAKDYTIKDTYVIDGLNAEIAAFRQKIGDIGGLMLYAMDVHQLVSELTAPPEALSRKVDIIAFGRQYVDRLKVDGRQGSASTIRAVVNNLVDYFGNENVDITEITSPILKDFERYLRTDRKQIRNSNGRKMIKRVAKGLDKSGIHTIMRDFRILFNAARKHYNTELETIITHYPFDFYKVPPAPYVRKKGDDLPIDAVIRIRNFKCKSSSRVELARDIFMLSFYLCGMNAKDIYEYKWNGTDLRIEYERSKTRGRRNDNAFISIPVPYEARPLLERYNYKFLHRRYSSYDSFITAIDKGIKLIANGNKLNGVYAIDGVGIPELTFYHARHTFATLAYNKCGFTTDQIAAALNHVNNSNRVTASYIATDWSIIDKVQGGVLGLLSAANISQCE